MVFSLETPWKEVIQPMKIIRIFIRNVKSAFKSIFRNFSLSIASVVCTTITLVIVALAIIVAANVNSFTKDIGDSLTIIAFVDSKASDEEIAKVKSSLLEINNIRSDELLFKSKEDIKNETLENTEKGSTVYNIISSLTTDNNPLESEFIVSVKDIEKLKSTATSIEKIDKVTKVKYSDSVVDKMIPVFDIVKKITIGIILGLIVVTVFLICNTIKLTIFSRRSEIEIMRLVGTSNSVVRLPFVIEGLFLGIIGSIVPILVTVWGYIIAYDKLEGHLFSNVIKLIDPMPFVIYISILLVVIGGIVGMLGSYRTVRRYLKI